MIRHFFLDKTNTIIKGSKRNLGLNPVMSIGYGSNIMRGLIHFDICPIREMIEDKTFADIDKLHFTLKMTNYFSIDSLPYEKRLFVGDESANRAASFDLMLFRLPREFDEGRGFEFESDFWIQNKHSVSIEGSNWYFAKNGIPWDENADINNPDFNWATYKPHGGIYTTEQLIEEYEKYLNGEESIVIGCQHFDFGNENLSIDITKYIFEEIKKKELGRNEGLCLSFIPKFENIELDSLEYVGFVTDHTNTFFHPYIEISYEEYISDNRESFTVGCDNRLYLYVTNNGVPANLDIIPSCSIDGIDDVEVKQSTKGVYYAQIPAYKCNMEKDLILTDTWSKIALNGNEEDDVELEFVTHDKSQKISIGNTSSHKADFIPSLYGINDDEHIGRGEIREITVEFREKFSNEFAYLIDTAYWRLYVKDGNREYDVINYQPIEKGFLNNFFMIYTEDLIPNEYYIDIMVNEGRERKFFKKVLRFTVVSNVTERYE